MFWRRQNRDQELANLRAGAGRDAQTNVRERARRVPPPVSRPDRSLLWQSYPYGLLSGGVILTLTFLVRNPGQDTWIGAHPYGGVLLGGVFLAAILHLLGRR